MVFILFSICLCAQRDLIIKKDSTQIRCKILKESPSAYNYAFINSSSKVVKKSVPKSAIDTVIYNAFDSNLITHKLFTTGSPVTQDAENLPANPYQVTVGIGLTIGNVLEFNSSSGPDKKSLSFTTALDLGLNYFKESKPFTMTNELHWTLAVQLSALTGATHLQRSTDDLTTLHDFSLAMSKSHKWNFNLIIKTNTSIFTIYDGDFFKDYNSMGKVQAFLNPYQVSISPGIKFQPDDYLRLSLSPYSVSLYGLTNQQIANTGYYTQTVDGNNNYDRFAFKQLGAALNIWYDRKLRNWLTMQYRLGVSSDYFSTIASNGLIDGLFITKIKLIKNVSLAHRAILKGEVGNGPFKPYYNQTILLSYSKSF